MVLHVFRMSFHRFSLNFCSSLTQQVSYRWLESFPCRSSLLTRSVGCRNIHPPKKGFWICGPTKVSSFIFASLILGNFTACTWMLLFVLSTSVSKCFIRPSLKWTGGNNIFFTQLVVNAEHFSSQVPDCCSGQSLGVMRTSVLADPFTKKATVLSIATL